MADTFPATVLMQAIELRILRVSHLMPCRMLAGWSGFTVHLKRGRDEGYNKEQIEELPVHFCADK